MESYGIGLNSVFHCISSVALDKLLNLPEPSNVKMEIMVPGNKFTVHIM